MDFITDSIAIGDRYEAADLDLLLDSGISAVLNLAYDLDISYYRQVPPARYKFEIEYQKVGMIDGFGNQPTTFVAAIYMLDELLRRHRAVLVHCHAGVSRSSAVVAAYLAQKDGMDFDQALQVVRRKRPRVTPNPALVIIAKSLPNLFQTFS